MDLDGCGSLIALVLIPGSIIALIAGIYCLSTGNYELGELPVIIFFIVFGGLIVAGVGYIFVLYLIAKYREK